jgi:phage terminase large subunit-like protein
MMRERISSRITFDPLVGESYSATKRKEEEFLEVLRKYGITTYWDTELLVARYVYDMTMREIRREYHFTDLKTAFYRIRELRRLLVERGFKPRRGK